MAIELTDDGTLDTVLRCTDCGQEFRSNYNGQPGNETYERFLKGFFSEVVSEHQCEEPED